MPKKVKAGQKTIEGTLDQHRYDSVSDSFSGPRDDRPFEGTEKSLPPSSTNPFLGADGSLPVTKVSKVR